MALLFMDGFEMGDGALKWDSVSGYGTANTTPRVTNGGYYFHSSSTGMLTKNITSSACVTVGAAVRVSVIDANDALFAFQNQGNFTYPVFIAVSSSGFLEVWGVTGGFSSIKLATGTTKLVTGLWYYIEVQAIIHSTAGKVEVRLNGQSTPEISFTGNTLTSGSSTNIVAVSSSIEGDLDDYYILNSVGTTNTTFLGDVRVYALKPSANGTYSQLTGSDGDSTNNYQLVGEQPYNTTNYVGSSTLGQRDTYALADVPANATSVLGIQHNLIAAKSDAGAASMKPVLKAGNNLYYGATRSLNTVYDSYQDIYDTNPATSANWTISDVNSLEGGMEVA